MTNTSLGSIPDVLKYLQSKFGSADFNAWQYQRARFYSFVKYPVAGAGVLNFFGDVAGASGITYQLTNMPKAGSFGQVHFWLNALYTDFLLQEPDPDLWDGTDATAIENDMMAGFMQAGAFSLDIQQRNFLQLPLPFQYAALGQGRLRKYAAGVSSMTLTDASPGVTLTTFVGQEPGVYPAPKSKGALIIDPPIFIEAETNFTVSIQYPAGAVPVIATDVVDDDTNPLYVGVVLDGYVFRPQQ